MKEIKRFEKAIEEKVEVVSEVGINPTLFTAYKTARYYTGNDLLDFKEVIWDREIEQLANALKEENITEFTISRSSSNLIENLAEFEKHGFYMSGMTSILTSDLDWKTGEPVKIPAVKLEAR